MAPFDKLRTVASLDCVRDRRDNPITYFGAGYQKLHVGNSKRA